MNLHALAIGAISVVNAPTKITIYVSIGYTTGTDGRRTPNYERHDGIIGEIQPLSPSDLRQAEGMNISGETRKIYLNGRYYGANRVEVKGGDLIELSSSEQWPYGSLWQVFQVLEQYPDWCCLGVVRQLPETSPSAG